MTERGAKPEDYLRHLGEAGDGPHDIAEAALMLAALDHSDRSLAPYQAHLMEMGAAARAEAIYAHDAEAAAMALSSVLSGHYGYDGDRLNPDDPQNADLISVIDRRRGLPVSLGILYIHAARAGGLSACGLSSPGNFLLMVALRGSEALIDPFNGGAALDRERLNTPPALTAPGVPEDARLFETVSDIDVLLRLQNVIKTRALQAQKLDRALEVAQRMVLIAPKRAELWIEMGRMQEAVGALTAARAAYENCLGLAKSDEALHNEAALALHALKRRLN